MLWYLLFFAVALKIPTVWLCWVIWRAIQAKPDHDPDSSSGGFGHTGPDVRGPSWWGPGRREGVRLDRVLQRSGPHKVPVRKSARTGIPCAEVSDLEEVR